VRTILGKRQSIVLAAVVASAGACATQPELLPVSGHASPTDRRSLAVENRGGVDVTSDANVWHSSPENLPAEVTPVWVTVHNTTGQPVRVQYDEFTLREPSGETRAPLAPYTVGGSESRRAFEVSDDAYLDKFEVAPYLASFYPWLPVWDGPLPHGPSDQSVATLPGLPTAAMLEHALPEGVLENDGTASGYLYFQRIGAKNGVVRFLAVFEQPTQPGQPAHELASIDIPFHWVSRRRWPSLPSYSAWEAADSSLGGAY
jgi:hypothetical protein